MTDWSGKYTLEEYYKKTVALNCYPSFNNLIEMQLKFYDWWSNSENGFIIRAYKKHPRARIYKTSDGTLFVSSDNEACCSFYEYTYHNGAYHFNKDLFDMFIDNKMFISFPIQKEKLYDKDFYILKAKDYSFRMGGAIGNPFRSEHQLKLSHYQDAAYNLNKKDSVKKRCGIFLSPLNIILTPKKKRKHSGFLHKLRKDGTNVGLYQNDVGETKIFKDYLHSFLVRDLLRNDKGIKAYLVYCAMSDLDYDNQVGMIEQNIKEADKYEVEFVKASNKYFDLTDCVKQPRSSKKTSNMERNNTKSLVHNFTRFYVTQQIYEDLLRHPDCDLYINVTPKKGNHPKGHYLIPNKIAKLFIESKQGKHNWNKHQNFKQDAIPSGLTDYFINC